MILHDYGCIWWLDLFQGVGINFVILSGSGNLTTEFIADYKEEV